MFQSLRLLQDEIHDEDDFVNRFAEVRFAGSDEVIKGDGEGTMVLPNTPDELDVTWRGEDGWVIAAVLSDQLLAKN